MSLDGLLLVDKPKDWTSHEVVHKVRRLLGVSHVGHAGTLDPLATGLMVLLVGQATKISDYILLRDKEYEVTLRLGVKSDTFDRTGVVQENVGPIPSKTDIARGLESMMGALELEVPMFSAVRVKGKKLYEYARKGQEATPPVKLMTFYNLRILANEPPLVSFLVNCSKGSYIRSFAQELGTRLGCGGLVEELRRTQSSPHQLKNCVSLGRLEGLVNQLGVGPSLIQELGPAFTELAQALPFLTKLSIVHRDEKLLMNGQIPKDVFNRLICEQKRAISTGEVVPVRIHSLATGMLLSLLEAHPQKGLKIRRIFKSESTLSS